MKETYINQEEEVVERSEMDKLADAAVIKARRQLVASTDFKKPRLAKIKLYYDLYNGKTPKKLRQLFNSPIPIFPGMMDTLNAQYDSPIEVELAEGDASDYFKVKKVDALLKKETTSTSKNTKWDSKFRTSRKDAMFTGRGIVRYNAESLPEYKSVLRNVMLKNFHFQPKGGSNLENHLWNGEEGIIKTRYDLEKGAKNGQYNKNQVDALITIASTSEYLPESEGVEDIEKKLERFQPLGLDPDNNNYVGESVFQLVEWILNMNGVRYYLVFEPWTNTWLRFEPWKDINSSNLYPWDSWATHEDEENFLSKSYADDLYPSCDSIVALFNQELTNREKSNFHPRAYDKDMFTDVKKLDEAQYRPDALVPVDTKGGSRRISEGIYEFKVGELNGTVNLIDWITSSLGRNTGANDLAMGEVQSVSKKASVAFAEQKSISKRLSWASASFQDMVGSLVGKFIWGLKDHMPASVGIQLLGQNGWDWDQITRLDLDTTKDIDIIILSTDKQLMENELKSTKRQEALAMIGADPNLTNAANHQWRLEQILKTGEFDDIDIAVAMDSNTFADKKSLAHAAEAIQFIEQGKETVVWFGATIAFVQYIIDYATDKRSTLGGKFEKMVDYAESHYEIVRENIERQVQEESRLRGQAVATEEQQTPTAGPVPEQSTGMSGGMSRAMNMAENGMQ